MVYIFDSKFDRYQANKIYKIVSTGVLAKDSATTVINALKVKGLSYRRIEMLHDVRRARGVEFAKSRETKLTSGYFFDFTYEPFRKEQGLSAREANAIFRKWERDDWETPEEMEQVMEIHEKYERIQDLL